MKRIAVVSVAVLAIALVACEGDNPSSPGGTLPTVTNLQIDETASAANSIVLTWDEVTGETIEGYEVYFSTTSGGTWTALGTTSTNTYTDVASSAGYYSVRAYEGDNYSENYATAVNTMPYIFTEEDTIYDQYAPADYHSGYIFGMNGGTTGLASDPGFVQDIYCYDYSKGDLDAGFSSGDYGTYGNGNETWFYAADGVYGYCPAYGGSGWWNHGQLLSSDDVIFGYLYDDYYVKIYIDGFEDVGSTANGTGVTIHYEIQPIQGVTVFTTNSS